MADLTLTREIFAPPEGTILTPTDFTDITSDIDSVQGQLIRALGGPNFLPFSNPLQIVAAGGMNVTAAGSQTGGGGGGGGSVGDQALIAQGRFLDVCNPTNLAFAASGSRDRVDLIAVKAVRVQGAQTVSRTVVPDGSPSNVVAVKLTLAAGTVTYNFNPAFSAPPVVTLGAEGPDANSDLEIVVTATSLKITNTADAGDTRTIDAEISGSAIGSSGAPQVISLLENQPSYTVVQGTSTLTPQTPAGYEALATVYIHAGENAIATADITMLFVQLASPIMDAVFRKLTAAQLTLNGGLYLAPTVTATAAVLHQPSNAVEFETSDWNAKSNSAGTNLASLQASFDGTNVTFTFSGVSGPSKLAAASAVLTSIFGTAAAKVLFPTGIEVSAGEAIAVDVGAASSFASGASFGNLLVGEPFSAAHPGVSEDGNSGVNISVPAGAEFGWRFFTIGPGGGFTQVAIIDTSGNLSISGAALFLGGATVDGILSVLGNGNGKMLVLQDTTNTANAPIKILRANGINGRFELVNAEDTAVIFSVDDTGNGMLAGDLEVGGNLSIDGNLTVGGSIAADLSGNFESKDNSVLITDDNGKTNITIGVNRSFGDHVITGSDGSVTVQLAYVIIGGNGNYAANTTDNRAYAVQVDQQRSNFAQGKIVFKVVDGTNAIAGIGIYYTATTTNVQHS